MNRMLKKLTYRCVRLMLADDGDLEETLAVVEDETSSKEMLILTLKECVKGPSRLLSPSVALSSFHSYNAPLY